MGMTGQMGAVMHRRRRSTDAIRWETEDSQERTMVVGLLADPGLPTEIARQLAAELPDVLADQPRGGCDTHSPWFPRRCGVAGTPAGNLVAERREREGWDFAIGLTDLPVYNEVGTHYPLRGPGLGAGRPYGWDLLRGGSRRAADRPSVVVW
jgi:hypothetical protein